MRLRVRVFRNATLPLWHLVGYIVAGPLLLMVVGAVSTLSIAKTIMPLVFIATGIWWVQIWRTRITPQLVTSAGRSEQSPGKS